MEVLERHTVPEGTLPTRLSDYLPGVFQAIPSRKGIKKAIDRGQVQVDGQVCGTAHWVMPGARISLHELPQQPPKPYPCPIRIVYEDEGLAVADKPAGLTVSGNHYRTVVNALVGKLQASPLPDALPWALPVHRLDAPTSGLLLLAKSRRAHLALGQAFEAREIQKEYQAIVCGQAKEAGQIDSPLDGKPALTHFQRLAEAPSLHCKHISWLRLSPHTGRTHQLRRHLSSIGLPILGDAAYWPEGLPLLKKKGLFLCATRLRFAHPLSGQAMDVAISPPEKFSRFWERSLARWEKFS